MALGRSRKDSLAAEQQADPGLFPKGSKDSYIKAFGPKDHTM